jgi:hypothetical protein
VEQPADVGSRESQEDDPAVQTPGDPHPEAGEPGDSLLAEVDKPF